MQTSPPSQLPGKSALGNTNARFLSTTSCHHLPGSGSTYIPIYSHALANI